MGTDHEVQKIVNALEEDIVLWVITPGTRLIEDHLIERFEAKRHVARAALAKLSEMGLVERIPNRGSVVRSYDPEDVAALYAFRRVIEPAAAGQIPLPASILALEELKAIQSRHDKAAEDQDMPGLFRANLHFHRALFALCPNAFLTEAIEKAAMQAHAVRFSTLDDHNALSKAREEHHAMIDALSQGDHATLVTLCESHLQHSYDAYSRAMREREAS
ncbi:hypothetical protein ACMU_15215 [Actibacterium mucosum KCTC 23349]|uniref:HTH gntR-type domain-containing protein n=1 Tax=Actibacterium mucosum KCTC 23349 TaxID=1454373 RepID=A0A037ZG27_9RHOB|nr:GntR family transcriptional regulator [Actibacterium mucosum]KAJ55103.1 hypothetical protein ACMU_15215 [Actibacterium mucosum KCTC 23349]